MLRSLQQTFTKFSRSSRSRSSTSNNNKLSVLENKMARYLLAFDFDHTIVDENSDLYVIKLAPNGKLPQEIEDLYTDDGWTKYMGEVFKYLHQEGAQPQDLINCMSQLPLTSGMRELLNFTSSAGTFDHIIISDSNSVFIEEALKSLGLRSVIDTIFTNPAKFDESGCLTLKGYHFQDWCELSTNNMCKGHILTNYIQDKLKSGIEYASVMYVGDGYNDLCPSLKLCSQDFVFPRARFRLQKLISKMEEENKPVSRESLKAKVVPWDSGLDILNVVKKVCSD